MYSNYTDSFDPDIFLASILDLTWMLVKHKM